MGEPKIILQCGTSEGLTSEARGWVGVLGWASESLPCRAAAKGGKRSFVLILCKGVSSVCLLYLCSTSLKSFHWEERHVKELVSLGADLSFFVALV